MIRFCLFFLSLLFCAVDMSAQVIRKVSVTDLETYIRKSDHPMLVNFWATYCVPCIEEIPYFQKEVVKHRHLELLLVSLDLPDYYPEKILAFAKKNHYTGTIFWLNETNADFFCPKIDKNWSGGIPASLFVNNKTGFTKFFEQQLSPGQVAENCKILSR
jgi:thiol-disulfide isomerase/thioredoxin